MCNIFEVDCKVMYACRVVSETGSDMVVMILCLSKKRKKVITFSLTDVGSAMLRGKGGRVTGIWIVGLKCRFIQGFR